MLNKLKVYFKSIFFVSFCFGGFSSRAGWGVNKKCLSEKIEYYPLVNIENVVVNK